MIAELAVVIGGYLSGVFGWIAEAGPAVANAIAFIVAMGGWFLAGILVGMMIVTGWVAARSPILPGEYSPADRRDGRHDAD